MFHKETFVCLLLHVCEHVRTYVKKKKKERVLNLTLLSNKK